MDSFFFFGKVLPERADLTLANAIKTLESPDNGKLIGEISVDIKNSQVFTLLKLNINLLGLAMPNDFYTIKNLALNETKAFINLSSIFLGGGFDIDITKGHHLQSGYTETIAPRSLPIMKYIEDNLKIDVSTALRSTFKEEGSYIQNAIEDFSDALRIQNRNAMFLFFRAIESLRCYYGIKYNISIEKEQWEKLRNVLGIDRTDIDFIKNFADPVRHGKNNSWNISDIEKAEKTVWKMIHDTIDLHK